MWVENHLCGFCIIPTVSSLPTTLNVRLLPRWISCLSVLDLNHFLGILNFFVLLPFLAATGILFRGCLRESERMRT